ncbi:MAG: RDD family protein [Chlamydiia bacterium]|nr:RDD family protein [Chlamydiia bacterium]
MDKAVWYYKVGEEKTGPVSHQELQSMLDQGKVSGSTQVWTDSFEKWLPISDVEHFNMATLDETPTIVVEKPVEYARETDDEKVRPRPWVRFWARMIDYSLFMLVIGLIIGFFRLGFGTIGSFSGILAIFLWTFVEAALLCTVGTTPGKALLRITVRDKNHHKLNFSESLNRSFSVWWLGMGAGIPIISLVTMIVAAVKLSNTGMTSWDRRSEHKVFHNRVGIIRILIVILYFLCNIWVLSWGQMEAMKGP